MKHLYEIEGREYLESNHSQNYNLYKDLYFGDHYKHFNIDEFEHSLSETDYTCFNICGFAVDTLTNLYNVNKMEVSTPEFEEIRKKQDIDAKLEQMLRDYLIYGSAYMVVSIVEDQPIVQNVNPRMVYAKYNEFNYEMEPEMYTVVHKKQLDKDEEVYLLIDYKKGGIIATAYLITESKIIEVEVSEYFGDVFSGEFRREGNSIVIDLPSDVMPIIALQADRKNSFYGESIFSTSAISLQEATNKMANLAKFAITQNSIPKMKLSSATADLLEGVINESTGENHFTSVAPSSFTHAPKKAVKYASSWINTRIMAMFNRKLIFFKEDGRGTTEYIVNPYKLDDLFRFQKLLENKLLTQLHIASVFYDPEISGNFASGLAYIRLMQNTISAVEDLRSKTSDQIALLITTIFAMQGQTIADPKMIFPPVIEQENKTVSNMTADRVNNERLQLANDRVRQTIDATVNGRETA